MLSDRRAFTNLLLFVGVAAMAFIAWQDHVARNAPPSSVLETPPQDISRIEIDLPKRARLVLEKSAGTWWLHQPFRAPLQQGRVGVLLSLAEAVPASRYSIAGRQLADFGLEPARGRLQLNDAMLRFGDQEPSSGRRYVQHGEQILLLEDQHLPLLDAGLKALADLRPVGDELLASLTLPDGSVVTAPEQLDNWRIARAAGIEAVTERGQQSLLLTTQNGQQHEFKLLAHPVGYALQPANAEYQLLFGEALGLRLGLPASDEL